MLRDGAELHPLKSVTTAVPVAPWRSLRTAGSVRSTKKAGRARLSRFIDRDWLGRHAIQQRKRHCAENQEQRAENE